MIVVFKRRVVVFFALCVGTAFALFSGGCVSSDKGFAEQSKDKKSFGEIAYGVVEYNLAQSDACQDPLVVELQQHRSNFIGALDTSIPPELLNQIQSLMENAILPAIDSGELQDTTKTMADLLAMLNDPQVDPNQNTLRALLNLAQTRTIITQDQVLDLVEAGINDEAIKNVTRSLANLAQHHDGVDYAINSATDLLSRQLIGLTQEHLCQGLSLGDLEETLLKSDVITGDSDMGEPAWTILADIHGNPRVRINPNTGHLFLPFIDINADQAADVNDKGEPIDSSGNVIELPVFADSENRDSAGRAVDESGQLIYEYYDAKRSGLAMMLMLVREALQDGLHREIATVVDNTIPIIEVCHDGTSTCRKYPSDDNPFADIAWTLIEVSRFDDAAIFLRTWSELIKENPTLAEDIIVAIGQVLEAAQLGGVELTDPSLPAIVAEALPLLDDVFQSDNTTGQSTGQLLLELVHDLGQRARDVPEQILDTIEYAELVKNPSCTDAKPDYEQSIPVDYELPRYYQDQGQWFDNRSSIEESIELLSAVDCGSVPFTGGQSVAEFVIELLANRDEETVCGVIDLLLGTIDTFGFLGEFATTLSLDIIGCDGDDVFPRLEALESLAHSGALNGYLPIAQVFLERDQLDTLLDIFHLAANDLHRDEDGNANTQSVVRQALPVVGNAIRAGAVYPMFDLADLLVTTQAVNQEGTMGDVIMNSVERMVDDDGTVRNRQGPQLHSSLAAELVKPVQTIVERLNAAQRTDSMDRLLAHFTGYITQTHVDNGNTTDPSDDRVVLTNPRFLPLTTIMLDFVAQLLELPEGQQTCYFDIIQDDLNGFFTGRNFATMVRLIKAIENAAGGDSLESFAIRALDPNTPTEQNEIFGPALVLLGGLIQAPIDVSDMESLMAYLSHAMDPSRTNGRLLVSTFDNLIERDANDVLLTATRNLVNRSLLPSQNAPIQELASTFMDVASIDTDNICEMREELSITEAAELVDAVVQFMNDDENGLGAVYELLGMRTQ